MRTMRWRAVSRVGDVVVVVVVVGATTAANTVAVGAVGVGAGVVVGSGVGIADGRAEGAGVGDAPSVRATGPAAVAFVGWKTMVPPMATSMARPRARIVSRKMLLSARTRRAGARRGDGTVPPGQVGARPPGDGAQGRSTKKVDREAGGALPGRRYVAVDPCRLSVSDSAGPYQRSPNRVERVSATAAERGRSGRERAAGTAA